MSNAPRRPTVGSIRWWSKQGRGMVIEDVDGNLFLDFMAGIAVASTGHAHPRVVKAIEEQARKFLHICGSDFYYEPMVELAEKLARLAPGKRRQESFLHQLRHRNRRGGHQARALSYQAPACDRLSRRLSWPDDGFVVAHRQPGFAPRPFRSADSRRASCALRFLPSLSLSSDLWLLRHRMRQRFRKDAFSP